MDVRVVTLNLWGDREPLAARLDAAARALAALRPDVVLLQEVRCGDGLENTAARLAGRLGDGCSATYACATAGPAGTWGAGSGAGEEGLAVLTRHRVVAHRELELPEARPDERRLLLSARLEIEGRPVDVHTTHLHWRLGDGLARERQVLALDEAARAFGADAPRILAGDFNAAPDTDEIRFLTGKHTLGGRRTVWQDAFARVRPHEDGWTWASRNPQTEWLRWLDRDRRIDYVFVSPEAPDGRGRVLDARVALDAPDPQSGVWPSDHFAVVADVQI